MNRTAPVTLIILVVTIATATWLLRKPAPAGAMEEAHGAADFERGPHGGRLLRDGTFSLEMTLFETGTPPEFHVYPYLEERPLAPDTVQLTVTLSRTGGVVERFDFEPRGDFLRSGKTVVEPHSFDVAVAAAHAGKTHTWRYGNYEGRTVIPDAMAREAGIVTEKAGPAVITESRVLTGRVAVDPARRTGVRARFPGIVKQVHAAVGDTVQAGQRLLTIQSNESLQEYGVPAPISGQIVERGAQPGNAVFDETLFTIVDLSRVWIELEVFPGDTGIVKPGDVATIQSLDGFRAEATIDTFAPLGDAATQSRIARLTLDNPGGRLQPGQFIRADVIVARHEVPLAVRATAVQAFRDFDVVYGRFGETYEVRMLELGRRDVAWIEVLGGLAPGTEYVTENSYLIKADIEKSGASHDH